MKERIKTISYDEIISHNPCEQGMKTLLKAFPRERFSAGIPLTNKSLEAALSANLNIFWMERFLTPQKQIEFEKFEELSTIEFNQEIISVNDSIKRFAWRKYKSKIGAWLIKNIK